MSAPGPTSDRTDPSGFSEATYTRMALVLRLGLLVAVAILAASMIAEVARAAGTSAGYWVASNPLVRHLNLVVFGRGLASGDPLAFLTLGVYALIATPVVRVAAGLGAFAYHGNRRMTALTASVLVLLLFGLLVVGPLVR